MIKRNDAIRKKTLERFLLAVINQVFYLLRIAVKEIKKHKKTKSDNSALKFKKKAKNKEETTIKLLQQQRLVMLVILLNLHNFSNE
jgi:cell shape-determining protein MreC